MRFWHIIFLISIAGVLSGCSFGQQSPESRVQMTTALPITVAPTRSKRATAQERWREAPISSYDMVIKFYEAFAVGLTTERRVSVRNGHVVTATCSPSGYTNLRNSPPDQVTDYCPAFVFRNVFTVEDLFRISSGGTTDMPESERDQCIVQQAFDDQLGYPTYALIDCAVAADDEHSFSVTAFTVFP